MLDNEDEINSFLVLHGKTEGELKTICETMKLDSQGEKNQLIERLLSLTVSGRMEGRVPQQIALRTQVNGKSIPGAIDFMKKIRKLMFNTRGTKEFSLLNGKNSSYSISMNFAKCSTELLVEVFEKGLILPAPSQKELILNLKTNPEKFQLFFVSKKSKNGKNFVMLHATPLAA